jgi:hypothetical protein
MDKGAKAQLAVMTLRPERTVTIAQVVDAGCRHVQIDEPGSRSGMPSPQAASSAREFSLP